ncbi:MAG: TetR/AcrR family transcriptional regulator [Thermodesulfobacteriota bacterium]|nr:TetR/AcrR family transcriptional regulator [Thermodesulfobacteriota bacterium]
MEMDKKMQIISVAAELMSRKGYRDTTLNEIASGVGLDKSSLFHYFRDKNGILDMVVGQSLMEAIDSLKDICSDSSRGPDVKLKLAIRVHVETLVKNFHSIKVFFDEFRSFSRKKQVKFTDERKEYERLFEMIVTEVQRKGPLKGFNSKIVTFGIVGMCNWLIHWYKEDPSYLSPQEIAETFYNMLSLK